MLSQPLCEISRRKDPTRVGHLLDVLCTFFNCTQRIRTRELRWSARARRADTCMWSRKRREKTNTLPDLLLGLAKRMT